MNACENLHYTLIIKWVLGSLWSQSVNENCTQKSKPLKASNPWIFCVIYNDSSAIVLLDFCAVQIAHDQLKEENYFTNVHPTEMLFHFTNVIYKFNSGLLNLATQRLYTEVKWQDKISTGENYRTKLRQQRSRWWLEKPWLSTVLHNPARQLASLVTVPNDCRTWISQFQTVGVLMLSSQRCALQSAFIF